MISTTLSRHLGCEANCPNQSMFCIGHAPYAQGMLAALADVALEKFTIIGARRVPDLIADPKAAGSYMSVSLHHYLN